MNKLLIVLTTILIITYILLFNKIFTKTVMCTSIIEKDEYKKTQIVFIDKEVTNKIIIESEIKPIINQFNEEYKKDYDIEIKDNKLIAISTKKKDKDIIKTLEKNGYTCSDK